MNEIIKELIDRCTTHYNGGLGTEIEVFDKEKFAQLIVQECIKICSDVEADTEMDLSDGALVCMAEIKEHFGVSE
jgi:hypothetical protein